MYKNGQPIAWKSDIRANHVLVLPVLEPVFINLWTGIQLSIEQNVSTEVTLNMLT